MPASCHNQHKTKTLSANVLSFRRDSFAGENMQWDKGCILMFSLQMLRLREQMKQLKAVQLNLSVFLTSEAASPVALSILMPPDPEAASLFMGCTKGGSTGTSGLIFFPTDTRSLASLSYQFSSHLLACTRDLGKQRTP